MKIDLPSDISQLLGGLSPLDFLRRYWHKKPLLIRRAIPGFKSPLSKSALFRLAGRDDVESRRVSRRGRTWSLEPGPLTPARLRAPPAREWTLLVQGVDLRHAGASEVLHRFDFIPAARLDDLMISYAVDGGGVGPHFDSYDVFLLQAHGRRRWRVSTQRDKTLVTGAPLKILRNFQPEHEYLLEPGDMLYLPPGCAHEGVAVGESMTCSIGFRAPSATELARGMLEHLADTIERKGMYADPMLRPTPTRAHLDDAFVRQAARLIGALRPSREQVAEYLGRTLSEPKPNVIFDVPLVRLTRVAFVRAVERRGLKLDLRSRMLHRGPRVYINGDAVSASSAGLAHMSGLADGRRLGPQGRLTAGAVDLFYAWYTYGWLHPGDES